MPEDSAMTLYGKPIATENPFLKDTYVPITKRRIKGNQTTMAIFNPNTGEVAGSAEFYQIIEVDATQFVKVFVEGWRGIIKLNSSGLKVLAVLFAALQKHPGRDQIPLSHRMIDEATRRNIGYDTFQRGLADLEKNEFIYGMPVKGLFWINPHMLFNGDVLRLTKEYRITKQTQTAESKTANAVITQKQVDPNQIDIEEAIAKGPHT